MLRRLLLWVQHRLAQPRAWLLIPAAAFLLYLPSLYLGLQADDHWHRVILLNLEPRPPYARPAWDLFRVFDGIPSHTQWAIENSLAPWTTDPNVQVSFFRPLAGLSHGLDYLLFPSHPWLMHLHSIGLYVGVVWAAYRFFGQLLEPSTARLAALLFAIDHTHTVTVAWIANRNALVAGVLTLLALTAHVRAAQGTRPHVYAGLSGLFLFLGLLGGETALAGFAYVWAYTFVLDSAPLRARLYRLLPSTLAAGVWFLLRTHLNYGAHGSGNYVDPSEAPLRFAWHALERLPLLWAGELGMPAPDLALFAHGPAKATFTAVMFLGAAVSAVIAIGISRRNRVARFMFLAGALSLLPACGTLPSTRLLLLPSLGILGGLALIAAEVVGDPFRHTSRILHGYRAWMLGGHLVLSPVASLVGMFQLTMFDDIIRSVDRGIEPVAKDETIIVVRGPDLFMTLYTMLIRSSEGRLHPDGLYTLSSITHGIDITRRDNHTLVLHSPDGYTGRGLEDTLTTARRDFASPVRLRGVTVTVEESLPNIGPTKVAFTFHRAFGDPKLRLFEHTDGRLIPFSLPAIGQTVHRDAQRIVF